MIIVNNMIRLLETHFLGAYGNKMIRALLPILCLDGTIESELCLRYHPGGATQWCYIIPSKIILP